eukprot:496654-Pyramimonas_sp.AAC.1
MLPLRDWLARPERSPGRAGDGGGGEGRGGEGTCHQVRDAYVTPQPPARRRRDTYATPLPRPWRVGSESPPSAADAAVRDTYVTLPALARGRRDTYVTPLQRVGPAEISGVTLMSPLCSAWDLLSYPA